MTTEASGASGRVGAAALLMLSLSIAACDDECARCVDPVCPACPACTALATVVFEPVVDAYIEDGGRFNLTSYPKDGVGDRIYRYEHIVVSNNASQNGYYNLESRGVVEFMIHDVTAAPDTALLEFIVQTIVNPSYLPTGLALHHYKGDGAIDKNDFLRGRLAVVDTVVFDRDWIVSFDVTEAIRERFAAGDTCAGFNIRMVPETLIDTGGVEAHFRGLSTGPPPRLTVVFPRPVGDAP